MDDRTLYARQYASLCRFCDLIGRGAPDSRVFEQDGVIAAIVPATPDRSICNSAAYETTAGLERALPDLAAAYGEAGVRAWTVWVPPADARAQALLRDAGHVLDAEPAAMALELDRLREERPAGLDLDPEPTAAKLGAINDAAYTFGTDDFSRGLRALEDLYIYIARADGEAVTCVGAHDHDGDCSVTFVATLPPARGRGLAKRLLLYALHDARERGCTTTSLQATKAGYPMYLRLGYRDLGPVQMWERRTSVQ